MKHRWIIAMAVLLLTGCSRHQTSEKPPVHLQQNMMNQPKVKPQAESRYFADGLAMLEPVEGTVARGWLRQDSAYFFGKLDGKPVKKAPVSLTLERLQRGRQRFDIYCSPCHGRVGDGKSIMVMKGMLPPPSFHEQRLIDAEDGYLYDVITNGLRNMPPYKYQVPVDDRWAIIGYVRALQRSHRATIDEIPPAERPALQ
jgi:mono/diheme cytochrome c family protein